VAGEVDLARYGRAFLRRSWIVAIGVVIGAAIGVIASRESTTSATQARATLYLGTPITPQGTAIPGTLNANPATVSTIVKEAAPQRAAEKAAGLPDGALAGHVSSGAIGASLAAGASGRANPIFEIVVEGPWRTDQVQRAAASLAKTVVDATSVYAVAKLKEADEEIASLTARTTALATATAAAKVELAALAKDPTPVNVALQAPLMQTLATNAELEAALQQRIQDARLLRVQAREVEASRVVTAPVGRRIDAVARRSALGAGILLGLVVGVLAAAASVALRPP
jgi:hypothetical protein